jgi:hypothetical protein
MDRKVEEVKEVLSIYIYHVSYLLSLIFYYTISYSSLILFIFYLLSFIHPASIRHRPRQAEHPLMAALRARRGSTAALRGCSACLPLIPRLESG